MKRLFVAVVGLGLVACTRYAYTVTPLPMESGHYVLVQTSAKKRGPASKVYDCKSYQEILNEPAAVKVVWVPTCTEVNMQGPANMPK